MAQACLRKDYPVGVGSSGGSGLAEKLEFAPGRPRGGPGEILFFSGGEEKAPFPSYAPHPARRLPAIRLD